MVRVLGAWCGCGPPDGLAPLDRHGLSCSGRARFAPPLLPRGPHSELELPPSDSGVIVGRGPPARGSPNSVDRILLLTTGRERCGPRPGRDPRPRPRARPRCSALRDETHALAAPVGIGDPRPRGGERPRRARPSQCDGLGHGTPGGRVPPPVVNQGGISFPRRRRGHGPHDDVCRPRTDPARLLFGVCLGGSANGGVRPLPPPCHGGVRRGPERPCDPPWEGCDSVIHRTVRASPSSRGTWGRKSSILRALPMENPWLCAKIATW